MQATRRNTNPPAKHKKATTEIKQPVPHWDATERANVSSLFNAAPSVTFLVTFLSYSQSL